MKFGFSFSSNGIAILVLLGLVVSGCSPEQVSRKFVEPKQDFGPTRTDGTLPIDEIQIESMPNAASLRWKGDIETSAWYRASEDLGWLARQMAMPIIAKLSYRMQRAVGTSAAWEHTFTNSAYTSAAIGETRDATKKAVNAGTKMLEAQEPIIERILAKRSAEHEWPTGRDSLVVVVDHVDQFLKEFVRDVERSGVDKAVKKEIIDELRVNFGPRVQRIRAQIALAYSEPKAYDFVSKVRRSLKDEGVDLGAEIEAKLDIAERLPRQAETIHDSRSALSVLIDFWMAASPATREAKFKPMAKELYDFLYGKNNEDLVCIQTGCGPLTTLKRVLFILPAIEAFGPDKIRQLLASAAEESVKSELESQAVDFLPRFHHEVNSRIAFELARQRTNISKIANDYGTYLRLVLGRVAVSKLGLKDKDTFAGVEPIRIRVDFDFSKAPIIEVQRVPTQNRANFKTGAAAIGSGIASAIELHDFHIHKILNSSGHSELRINQALSRLYFEQLNKVLMVGGFATETSRPFDALSISIEGEANANGGPRRFNLRTLLSSDSSFAVPDTLALMQPTKADLVIDSAAPKIISASVAGQAEMLKGLSRIAASLRDWEVTPFDQVLGAINLADFVPDLPRVAVDRKLFPKELFYAASIGNAGALLQNMTKRLSSVGLIQPGGAMHWGNELDPAQDPTKQAIAATVFDIVNGHRAEQAKTVDVARFLSAVADFLKASDGIEKTQAGVLIDIGAEGRRAVDQVIEARGELKLLVMALGNFLSSQAVGVSGVVLPVFTRSAEGHGLGRSLGMSGEPLLIDQAVVIRALLDASDVIAAGIYRTAALDLMSATNAMFFRSQLAFYSASAKGNSPLSLESLASILIAGERLSPFFSTERVWQWRQVSGPWLNALRDAAESLP